MSETAAYFRIEPYMVSKWNKMRGVLGSVNLDCRRIGSGFPPQLPELENAVYEWLIERRKKKLVVKYGHFKSYANVKLIKYN